MTILLCCGGGFSTSIVVSKMKEEAAKQGKNYTIYATAVDDAINEMDHVDVILLGPHMKYMLAQVQKDAAEKHVAVGVIDVKDYGRANGPNVLKQAESLVNGGN